MSRLGFGARFSISSPPPSERRRRSAAVGEPPPIFSSIRYDQFFYSVSWIWFLCLENRVWCLLDGALICSIEVSLTDRWLSIFLKDLRCTRLGLGHFCRVELNIWMLYYPCQICSWLIGCGWIELKFETKCWGFIWWIVIDLTSTGYGICCFRWNFYYMHRLWRMLTGFRKIGCVVW